MIDEIQNLQDPDLLKIRWSVGNVCNYSCKYCESNKGDYSYPKDTTTIFNNFCHLLDCYKKIGKTKFELELSGGEPTLWPELGSFSKEIKNNYDIKIKIISNGSRTLRWWNAYKDAFDKVIFSFHYDQADIDHFINVIDLLVEHDVDVNVLVLMDPNNFENCKEKIKYMKKNRTQKWFIESRPIFPIETFPVLYTEEQKNYMKKGIKSIPKLSWFLKRVTAFGSNYGSIYFSNGKKFKADSSFYILNQNNFKGWKCDIELENIYIHWTGILQGSCGQELYDTRYNINDIEFLKNFKTTPSTKVCTRSSCWCQPETHITKTILF